MASPLRITVVVSPNQIDAGQMVQISAIITDKLGAPVVVPVLYMEILDSKGLEYWKLSPIVRDANGFSKLISTNELKPNTRYTVRVTTNRTLSPQGYSFFKTTRKKLIPLFIPVLLSPIILTPEILKKEKVKVKEKEKKPVWIIYRTKLDAKVCVICKPHEGKRFRLHDPDIIRIGPPELGGETHYNDRCHYDMELAVNPAFAKIQRMLKSVKVVMAVQHAIKKNKEKELLVQS